MEQLRCTQCKNLLSYFPIYVLVKKNENICGRCWRDPPLHLSKNSYGRNKPYEALAQEFKFPCRYKKEGCLENLTPTGIPKHEDNCFYKIVTCPLSDFVSCVWQGSRSQIFEHCEEKHNDLFLKNYEFKIVLSKSHESRNLLKWENFIFLVTTKFESVNNMLELSVCHLKDVFDMEECFYHVYFRSADRSLCIKGVTSGLPDVKTKAIFLDSLKNLHNESPTVSGKFKFIKSEEPSPNSVFKEKLNEDLLSQLKCSICLHYALPPIYEYGEGQVKCAECRDEDQKVKSQPNLPSHYGQSSRQSYNNVYSTNRTQNRSYDSVTETRNFTLDKIANVLNYPCKYQKSGCNFVSKPEEMKKHQISCILKVHECPVNEYSKCEWKGIRKEMSTHLYNNHNEVINQGSQISECTNRDLRNALFRNRTSYLTQLGESNVKCYIMNLSNRLYRLSFTIKDQHYYWELQTVDHLEKTFSYEIEIVNNKDQQQRLVARQSGSTLSKKDELFTIKNRCCILHASDVEHFLSPQKEITFKVNVTK